MFNKLQDISENNNEDNRKIVNLVTFIKVEFIYSEENLINNKINNTLFIFVTIIT